MNKPLTPVDLVGADFQSASQAYIAQRKTIAKSKVQKSPSLADKEARQRLKDAVSEQERIELMRVLNVTQGRDVSTVELDRSNTPSSQTQLDSARQQADADRLRAFQHRTALSMMAGGKIVDDMAELKMRAMNNIAQDTNGSLHDAQLRVDSLIGSGQSKDMAELVNWSNVGQESDQQQQKDAARDMGLEMPTPKPQHKRKVDKEDEQDRAYGR